MFGSDYTSMFSMNNYGMSPFGSQFYGLSGCGYYSEREMWGSLIGNLIGGVTFYALQKSQSNSTNTLGTSFNNGNQIPEDEAIRNDSNVQNACKFFGTTDYKEALKYNVNKDALVKDYDAQIKTAQKEFDTQTKLIAEYTNQIQSLNSEVGTLNTNLDNIKAQINALNNSDANYNTQYADLSAQKTKIEAKIEEKNELLNDANKSKTSAEKIKSEAATKYSNLTSSKEARINVIETKKEELYKAVANVVNKNKALIDKAADKADASWIQRRDFRELFNADGSFKDNADVKPAHVSSAAKAYTEALPDDKERMGQKFVDLYNKLDQSEKKGQLRLFYNMIKNTHPNITEA